MPNENQSFYTRISRHIKGNWLYDEHYIHSAKRTALNNIFSLNSNTSVIPLKASNVME